MIEKKTIERKLKPKGEFHLTEMQATNAPVENIQWHGEEIDTSQKIEDPGTGRPVILRCFDFELPKDIPRAQLPNKDVLLKAHRGKILAFLLKDELELIQELKYVQGKGRKFKIFATCQARKGSIIPMDNLRTLKPLQNMIQDNLVPARNTK